MFLSSRSKVSQEKQRKLKSYFMYPESESCKIKSGAVAAYRVALKFCGL